MRQRATLSILAPLLALAVAAGACSGGGQSDATPATDASSATDAAVAARDAGPSAVAPAAPAFASGPAVLVSAGYEPPTDRVDSTGAYLPANGKPTFVFVDAIW